MLALNVSKGTMCIMVLALYSINKIFFNNDNIKQYLFNFLF